MSAWTHPICERCWFDREFIPETPDSPASVRTPTTVKDPNIEVCCFCGMPTIFGCFVRSEPMSHCQHTPDEPETDVAG